MLNRRSLFKRLAQAVAIVVLAPEIAFSAKLKVTEEALDWRKIPLWTQTTCIERYFSPEYLAWRAKVMADFSYQEIDNAFYGRREIS